MDKPPDEPIVKVNNPLALIDKMIEKGTDPVALGKMMDLAERWKAARAVEEFAEAMTKCQAEMPVVIKDAANQGKRYARLEEVNRVIKPCYTSHGFSISFGEADCPVTNCCRIIADVRHAGGHSVPYRVDMPVDGTGAKGGASAMNATQAKGSTFSYGKRYLICMIFNVTIADEDKDGVVDDDPTLTDKQIEAINTLTSELQELGATHDNERFLAFMLQLEKGQSRGDLTLGDARQSQFSPAVEMLTRKIATAKKAGVK